MQLLTRRLLFGVLAPLSLTQVPFPDPANADFKGAVKTEWLDPKERGFPHGRHDRDMKVLEDFKFTDSKGCEWKTPKGYIVDGASIPSVLWGSIQGSPYVVDFRRATVIHDYYCDKKHLARHEDVDRSFYESILADDVPKGRAKLVAGAVHLFNKWPEPTGLVKPFCPNEEKFVEE